MCNLSVISCCPNTALTLTTIPHLSVKHIYLHILNRPLWLAFSARTPLQKPRGEEAADEWRRAYLRCRHVWSVSWCHAHAHATILQRCRCFWKCGQLYTGEGKRLRALLVHFSVLNCSSSCFFCLFELCAIEASAETPLRDCTLIDG